MTVRVVVRTTNADAADVLRHVAGLIDEGYTSGYHPRWWLEDD